MVTRRQLNTALQRACASRLPDWHIRRTALLYRRTDHFVQWLVFDTSAFEVARRPCYSLQALADQFGAEDLTLGDRIRDSRGGDLWITPALWEQQSAALVERIISQIRPTPTEPLTERAIGAYLEQAAHQHVSALTARGIVAVVAGDRARGRRLLEEAAATYGRIDQQATAAYGRTDIAWPREGERRHRAWLASADGELASMLREAAAAGAALLGLP